MSQGEEERKLQGARPGAVHQLREQDGAGERGRDSQEGGRGARHQEGELGLVETVSRDTMLTCDWSRSPSPASRTTRARLSPRSRSLPPAPPARRRTSGSSSRPPPSGPRTLRPSPPRGSWWPSPPSPPRPWCPPPARPRPRPRPTSSSHSRVQNCNHQTNATELDK